MRISNGCPPPPRSSYGPPSGSAKTPSTTELTPVDKLDRREPARSIKFSSGKTPSRSETLRYQDQFQRGNQVFKGTQGRVQAEHEKNKSWAQSLGRI